MIIPSLNFERRYPVQIGEPDGYYITLVGCGGTGSFVALHLARLAYHLREQKGLTLHLCFIDPDVVEAKNIGRQNFCPAEIGQYKAVTLAQRYSAAFGLEIMALPQAFAAGTVSVFSGAHPFTLVVGCVDNAPARRGLAAVCADRQFWWLDCGNHEHAGQVLLGNRDIAQPEITLGFCGALPLPSVQHPELVESASEETVESCAELALREAQSLMVNQAVATFAAQYVYRLLVSRDLDVYATYFDLLSGGARSLGITENLRSEF